MMWNSIKNAKSLVLLVFLIVTNIALNAQVNDLYRPSTYKGYVVYHKYYSLSYSEGDEQSEWVYYKLNKNYFNKSVKRSNNFVQDPKVVSISANSSDYTRSGYDRGHLAPAASMRINNQAMKESFYMSNISPQEPRFNRGIWKRLEEKVRYWAEINDSIFVVSGPVLQDSLAKIGKKNKVSVPKYFYKCMIAFKDSKIKSLAFLLENKDSQESLYKYVVPIDSVEKITGIDFFYKLDIDLQKKLESNSDPSSWFISN